MFSSDAIWASNVQGKLVNTTEKHVLPIHRLNTCTYSLGLFWRVKKMKLPTLCLQWSVFNNRVKQLWVSKSYFNIFVPNVAWLNALFALLRFYRRQYTDGVIRDLICHNNAAIFRNLDNWGAYQNNSLDHKCKQQ